MQNRSRADITARILQIAQGGASKTKIMYGACMSYTQLKEYLSLLIDRGLLLEDAKRGRTSSISSFKTTPKGFLFLNAYAQVGAFGATIGPQENGLASPPSL